MNSVRNIFYSDCLHLYLYNMHGHKSWVPLLHLIFLTITKSSWNGFQEKHDFLCLYEPDELLVVFLVLLQKRPMIIAPDWVKVLWLNCGFSVISVRVFGYWENNFLEKKSKNSPEKAIPRVSLSFACHRFPKTAGFAVLGLFCMMGPSPDIWWAEVGEISPRMSEHTGY